MAFPLFRFWGYAGMLSDIAIGFDGLKMTRAGGGADD
jgi:hypothetical protein